MMFFDFIVWNVNPEIVSIGPLSLRWYGLLFVLGFLFGQQILIRIYKNEGRSEKHVETLTVYMLLATIIGARLGHCFFYQPEYFLEHPLEILQVWKGGLASHGATVGILLAIYLYSKRETDQSYFYVLDRLVITIALAGCLIRLGNLMNSEIYGKQTALPFGFVFVHSIQEDIASLGMDDKGASGHNYFKKATISSFHKDTTIDGRQYALLNLHLIPSNPETKTLGDFTGDVVNNYLKYGQNSDLRENIFIGDQPLSYKVYEDNGAQVADVLLLGIPRQPTQIYEAGFAFLLFLLLFFMYEKHKAKTREGRLFGMFVFLLFSFRFLVEFLKAPQVNFENNMTLNMGQILSIPLIIAGLFILVKSYTPKQAIE